MEQIKKFVEKSAREIWRGLMMKKMEMICFKVVVDNRTVS